MHLLVALPLNARLPRLPMTAQTPADAPAGAGVAHATSTPDPASPWLFGMAMAQWGVAALWITGVLGLAAFAGLWLLKLPLR